MNWIKTVRTLAGVLERIVRHCTRLCGAASFLTSWSRKVFVIVRYGDHHLVHHGPYADRGQRQVEGDEHQRYQHPQLDAATFFLMMMEGVVAFVVASIGGACAWSWTRTSGRPPRRRRRSAFRVRFEQGLPVGFVAGSHAGGTSLWRNVEGKKRVIKIRHY